MHETDCPSTWGRSHGQSAGTPAGSATAPVIISNLLGLRVFQTEGFMACFAAADAPSARRGIP
jgi:hypothetical protein